MVNRLHGGDIWAYQGSKKIRFIDFSANINPLGPPACVDNILKKCCAKIAHYPESDARSLKDSIAQYHSVSSRNILAGNGSIELIYLIPKVFNFKNVLIVAPAFSEYEIASRIHGANAVFMNLQSKRDFIMDVSK